MLDGFRFYSPQWFVLAPAAIAAVWLACRPDRRPAVVFSSLSGLSQLPVTPAQRIRRILPLIYCTGLLLLIAALARPQLAKSESRINTEGIAMELALDISGSMEAMDFQLEDQNASRLSAVKHVIRQFVQGDRAHSLPGRPSDLIGVVAFAGFADSRCPPTLDHSALQDIVGELQTPQLLRDKRGRIVNKDTINEEAMTAIGDGLSLSLDRLNAITAKSKVVILLSDGDNNAGVVDPHEAAKAAKKLGIKVYTIGIGRSGWAPMPRVNELGERYLEPQPVTIDEKLLREIAVTSGGQYFNATNTEALTRIYAEIDQLEKSKVETTAYMDYTELFFWLALPGLGLVLLVSLLRLTRFRTLPQGGPQ